ncbi:MAG: 4Fe-4S dicluster domain-containing protein [Deltaproteobacteria bacterium]|nr:4Fe-4S dicluster domain-containing protein [Deltaproteobacteria bacterium]
MEFSSTAEGLRAFTEFLMKDHEVVAPVKKRGRFVFEIIDDASEVVRDYPSTLLPPVRFIYPDNERLLSFDLNDITNASPIVDAPRRALLFVHPCDIHAIAVMDEVLSKEPADANYLARRKAAIIIGYDCKTPCTENCLCFDKGCHKIDAGFDIMITELRGAKFFARAGSEAGLTALKNSGSFERASHSDKLSLVEAKEAKDKKFKRVLPKDVAVLSHELKARSASTIWNTEGDKCVSCGACNIVCPTCYCFDVADTVDVTTMKGERIRKWDSCQLSGFCKVASGENFRNTAASRLRHRVFKKEVYLKKRLGRSGCVGCGRCITHCIAKISIKDIFTRVMNGEE